MKKLLSAFLVVVTVLSLSTSALAENPYISNPELQNAYQNNMNLYYQYEAERNALDAQFKKDNPTVNYYDLYRTSWNANVFQNWSGSLLYTNYHGTGYYVPNGYTTVTDGWFTYNAIVLKSDPKPSVTATYIAKRNELTALMDKYYDAAENDVISSIDQDAAMLQKIKNWYCETYYDASCDTVDPDKTVYLIFQLGNYMYYSGQANRSSFYYGMIEQGNRRAVPYAVNGNTMIPIRALIEGLGGTVDWDAKLNGARATFGDNKITMPIGSEYAYVNDEPVKMTTPAVIANGKTMIPVRFVAENLGYDVEWVADGQFVVIKELAASKKIASYGFINGGSDNYYTNFENGEFSCYQLGKVGKYTFWSQGEDSHGDWGYYTCFITHSDIEDFDKYLSEHYSVSDRFDVPSGFKVYDCYMESDLDPDDDAYTVIVRYKNAPIMFEIKDYGYSSDRETFDKFVSDLLSSIYVIYAG